NGGWLRFDGSRLAEERGSCLAALQQADAAEPILLTALEEPLSLRRRAIVLTDLAAVGVQRRDGDQVIAYASEALQIAEDSHSGVVKTKLRGLLEMLQPLRSRQDLRELSERMKVAIASS